MKYRSLNDQLADLRVMGYVPAGTKYFVHVDCKKWAELDTQKGEITFYKGNFAEKLNQETMNKAVDMPASAG